MNAVLYHNNCTDGFMSAFIAYKYFKEVGQPITFIPVDYNQPMPEVKEETIYILDFSYPITEIEKLIALGKNVIMLDHHESGARMYGNYGEYVVPETDNYVYIYFKENESGAGMTYRYFKSLNPGLKMFKNHRFENIVLNVEDRDLWLFTLSETKIMHELLNKNGHDFGKWDNLIFLDTSDEFEKEFSNAKALLERSEEVARQLADRSIMVKFGEYEIAMANVPGQYASRVGEELKNDSSFSLTYFIDEELLVRCSLRTAKETGINVAKIAEKFGGGGHPCSAGFRLRLDELHSLLTGGF